MPHVIGLPLYRNNSDIYRPVKLHKVAEGFTDYFEGQAVFGGISADKDAKAYPTFGAQQGDGVLFGFILDINRKAGTATLCRAAESVVLPATAEAGISAGDSVSIDLATGRIGTGAIGERLTNAVVVSTDVSAVDGKTGKAVTPCVMIRLPALMDLGDVA